MDVVYHIGAHGTDEGQLVAALLKNRAALAAAGTLVPAPGRYRVLLRETLTALAGAPADAATSRHLLDRIVEGARPRRLVLSNENFLGVAPRALADGRLYPLARQRAAGLAGLFPDARCEIHLALRNPAAFVPGLLDRLRDEDRDTVMAGCDPRRLRWAELVRRLREGAPRARLVVWCDEDTPLIWPEVLRQVSGAATAAELADVHARLAPVMSERGLAVLERYLRARPARDARHRQRVTAAFLDHFALAEALEEEIDLPGWSEADVAEMSAAYEADTAEIAGMPGVTFLAP